MNFFRFFFAGLFPVFFPALFRNHYEKDQNHRKKRKHFPEKERNLLSFKVRCLKTFGSCLHNIRHFWNIREKRTRFGQSVLKKKKIGWKNSHRYIYGDFLHFLSPSLTNLGSKSSGKIFYVVNFPFLQNQNNHLGHRVSGGALSFHCYFLTNKDN